ncbi:MAG: peptidase T [Clostridia bacterium]|nr:peptidase T [Clostridia bacterium]
MKAYERLMKYAEYPTASDENNECCPSTPSQLVFARALEAELTALGLTEITLNENGYLFASVPATEGYEASPVIGFIAHMDVSSEVEDKNVKARCIQYNGGDITLNDELNIIMRADEYPILQKYIGKNLVVTDGTTLLGADDKAGIAEIITACEYLLSDKTIPHGKIRIGFTPDEEIGRGADLFDVEKFGAKWAYTLDGGVFGEVEYETFNASSLKVEITGKSIHPGTAKNTMINASVVAHEYMAMLPALERPEHTEGYEGFYHLTHMEGAVESAVLHFIIRDHDFAKMEARCDYARRAADELNRRYGEGTVKVDIKESYRNMKEMIVPEWHLIENAYTAIRNLGGEPTSSPIRGGTDGSRLSYMGLPCPNLGTGSGNHHGKMEFACVEAMESCTMQIIEIAKLHAKK